MKKLMTILFIFTLLAAFTQAQSKGDMGVSVQAGVGLPTGDFGEAWNLGFGGKGTFLYHLNSKLALTGSVGYFMFSGDEDVVGDDASYSIIPILAGARYHFGGNNFTPYVSGQVGLYSLSYEQTISGGFFGSTTVDASSSELGLALGGGFLLPLSPSLNLDVSARYDIVLAEGSSLTYLGVNAGVIIVL